MTGVEATLAAHILGPAHVGFVVPDLAAAVAEATRIYGIAASDVRYVPEEGSADTHFAFFQVAGLSFEYIEPRSERFRQLLFAAPSGGGGINHIAWRVRDIDGAVAKLAAEGIRPGYVTPGGVVAVAANLRMVYLDPDTTGGHLIELIEET